MRYSGEEAVYHAAKWAKDLLDNVGHESFDIGCEDAHKGAMEFLEELERLAYQAAEKRDREDDAND